MFTSLARGFNHVGNRCIHSLSPRELAALEDRLLSVVGDGVLDPLVGTNLRSLGWVDNRIAVSEQGVKIKLCLPTLLHPSLSKLEHDVKVSAQDELSQIAAERQREFEFPLRVEVQSTPDSPYPMVARQIDEHDNLVARLGPGLSHVAHFLAVYSCKGGVGKSTVAVNLAYELSRMGGRVGLIDVDIYGPSLPVLIHPKDPTVRRSPLGRGMVLPIEHEGVKIMSLGFVAPNSGVPGSGPDGGAAMMRGPMAGSVVTQLLKGTDWGDLDVLILDLPPGTGDVQLTVCQELQLSGAVAVTTPSKLAETDAKKGVALLTSMGVPTLAAVENMAYFDCEGGGRHYPFGMMDPSMSVSGDATSPKASNIFQLPISSTTNDANDAGSPLCLSRPEQASDELSIFTQLANAVSTELLLLQYSKSDSPQAVRFEDSTTEFDVASVQMSADNTGESFTIRLYSETSATQITVPAVELRNRDPKTGEKLVETSTKDIGESEDRTATRSLQANGSNPGLAPTKVEKKGHYGYAVEWSDGGTIIYSMLSIARAAGGV